MLVNAMCILIRRTRLNSSRSTACSSISSSTNACRSQPGSPMLFMKIGRATCRERVWQEVSISVVAVSLKNTKRGDEQKKNVTHARIDREANQTQDTSKVQT